MSLFSAIKALKEAIASKDISAILKAGKVVLDILFGDGGIPTFGAAEGEDLKAECAACLNGLKEVPLPVQGEVGKIGDGKLLELLAFVLKFFA